MATKKTTKKPKDPLVKRPSGRVHHMGKEEILNEEEPLHMPVIHKQRGRPKNDTYLPFEEAREFVRSQLIPSRVKYANWMEINKPTCIPKFPYRVYQDQWVSWNDYLGSNNVFGLRKGKAWREIEAAAMYVHTLKIETYAKWLEYCKENTLPADIPQRPDLVYAKWRTWAWWLGNKPIPALEAVQAAEKIQIFYIIHEQEYPENVLTFGVDKLGPSNFKLRWEQSGFQIIKMYWYDPKEAAAIKQIVDQLSTDYLGESSTRIVPNIWEILWHLSMRLELFRP
jgi:hypothetical protein